MADGGVVHDWLLERWVRLAELGVEVGVTLQTGGLLISGTLVGARKYLEYQRTDVVPSLVERGLPPLLARKLDRAFEGDLEVLAAAEQGGEEDGDTSRQFVHLREAWIVAAGGQRFLVPYWRGQLGSVDGFLVGTVRDESR